MTRLPHPCLASVRDRVGTLTSLCFPAQAELFPLTPSPLRLGHCKSGESISQVRVEPETKRGRARVYVLSLPRATPRNRGGECREPVHELSSRPELAVAEGTASGVEGPAASRGYIKTEKGPAANRRTPHHQEEKAPHFCGACFLAADDLTFRRRLVSTSAGCCWHCHSRSTARSASRLPSG